MGNEFNTRHIIVSQYTRPWIVCLNGSGASVSYTLYDFNGQQVLIDGEESLVVAIDEPQAVTHALHTAGEDGDIPGWPDDAVTIAIKVITGTVAVNYCGNPEGWQDDSNNGMLDVALAPDTTNSAIVLTEGEVIIEGYTK